MRQQGTGEYRPPHRSCRTAYAVWSREERRYVIHVEPEVEMTGDVVADTQHLQSRLEIAIRKYPDQWLWTHKRWKTRPPAAVLD